MINKQHYTPWVLRDVPLLCPPGVVQIFDLGRTSVRPAATIGQSAGGVAATCLAFNATHTGLLAVGSMDGTLNVWRLSSDLTQQGPREMAQLERLANEVAG